MPVVFKEDNFLLPKFQFKINEKLYPNKLEHILLREAKEWVEIGCGEGINENARMALIYTDPLLEADSENFYALFFKAMAAPSCKDVNWYEASYKAVNDFKKALDIARNKLGLTKEYYDFCEETTINMGRRIQFGATLLMSSMLSAASEIKKFEDQIRNVSGYDPQIENARRTVEKSKNDFKKACTDNSIKFEKTISAIFQVFCNWLDTQPIENLSDGTFDAVQWINQIKEVATGIQSSVSMNFLSVSDKGKKQFINLCDQKLIEIHKWRVAKYWETHPDEKADLEAAIEKMQKEIEGIEEEKAKAQDEINAEVCEETKKIENLADELTHSKDKLSEEIRTLEEEKSKQGLFALGAKKELKKKIEEKQTEIYNLEKDNTEKTHAIEDRIDSIREKGRSISKDYGNKIDVIRAKISKNKSTLQNKEN